MTFAGPSGSMSISTSPRWSATTSTGLSHGLKPSRRARARTTCVPAWRRADLEISAPAPLADPALAQPHLHWLARRADDETPHARNDADVRLRRRQHPA